LLRSAFGQAFEPFPGVASQVSHETTLSSCRNAEANVSRLGWPNRSLVSGLLLRRLIFCDGRRKPFGFAGISVVAARECLPCQGKEQPVGSVDLARRGVGHLRSRPCLGPAIASNHTHALAFVERTECPAMRANVRMAVSDTASSAKRFCREGRGRQPPERISWLPLMGVSQRRRISRPPSRSHCAAAWAPQPTALLKLPCCAHAAYNNR
jgi:hypothetical protein